MIVFVLQHCHDMIDGEEDTKFIDVYSTRAKAQEAIERLRLQPGFKDTPDDFYIVEYPIDKDHWAEGYVTSFSVPLE